MVSTGMVVVERQRKKRCDVLETEQTEFADGLIVRGKKESGSVPGFLI